MVSAKKPHFLVGFSPSASSERLKIPAEFVKHMEGWTSGTVSLVGPSGNTWHTDLTSLPDGLFIHNGWDAFVRDHFLELGDSLVFRYDGNLSFKVQVFDLSSCEKEAAFDAVCSQNPNVEKKRGRENSTLLDIIVEAVPKKMRSAQVQYECIKSQEPNLKAADNQGYAGEQAASVSDRYDETENCCSPNAVTIAVPSCKALSENLEAAMINRTTVEGSSASTVSASEADKIARSFTSSFPYFTKVMKRFNISGSYTLNIPYQFSMAHLPKCKVQIMLRNAKGQSWMVNSIPTTRVQTSHTFCGGWLAFVRDNTINLGDVCIFELVSKCELRVQVLRIQHEELEWQSGKETSKGIVNGCLPTSQKISNLLPKKMKGNSHKKNGFDNDSFKNGNAFQSSAFCSQSKTSSGRSLIERKSFSQDRLNAHTTGFTSIKSVPEEKIVAESFKSIFPHFVRIMKKFNISGSYTLKIPYQFSTKHLPSCKTEIILRNLKGGCWTVNSIPTTKVQTLHTFCGGWMAFVRDNDLQMRDICIFELVGKCEMRVHISRIGNEGLNNLSGIAASNELAVGSLSANWPHL